MIPKGAFLKVVDNSGGRLCQVIWTRFVQQLLLGDSLGPKSAAGLSARPEVCHVLHRRVLGVHQRIIPGL